MSNNGVTGATGNLTSGWSLNVGVVGVGNDYNTTFTSKQFNGTFGLPSTATTATTENTGQFSLGIKGTPLSLNLTNKATYTQQSITTMNGFTSAWSKPKLVNSTPGVNIGFSAMPQKKLGIGVNVSLGYKVDVQVHPVQATKSLFNWINWSGGGGGF
jgi:hypothetical protein